MLSNYEIRFIHITTAICATFCCAFSAVELYSEMMARGATGAHARGGGRLPITQSLVRAHEQAARAPLISGRNLVALSEIHNELSNRTFSKQRAQTYRCKAQMALLEAIKREPTHGAALVNLAFLRSQELNPRSTSEECQALASISSSSAAELARYAAQVDPLNQEVLSTSAFVLAEAGERREARSIIKRALALETTLPNSDPLTLLAFVDSRSEIGELLPRKLSVVTEWSERIRALDPESFALWSPALAQVQIETLQPLTTAELAERDPSLLLRLERVAASAQVAKTIHKLLADTLTDQRAARFYSSLATLERLPRIPASVESSSLMRNGALTDWSQSTRITLDRYYTAIGFFVAEPEKVRSINLRSERTVTDAIIPLLRVFVSENNYAWTDITSSLTVKAIPIERAGFVSISLPPTGLPQPFGRPQFWKVYFSGSQRSGAFTGSIGDMLEVYGRTASLPVE